MPGFRAQGRVPDGAGSEARALEPMRPEVSLMSARLGVSGAGLRAFYVSVRAVRAIRS
jgi:hypothetical protein